MRRLLLVSVLCFCTSIAVFAQRGAGSTGGGASGGTTAGTGPVGAPGTSAQGGIPTTAGTIGGLSGQAASGPTSSLSGNSGVPTVQQTMGGPAGTTGTNQGDPNNLNTFPVGNNGFIGGGGVANGGVLLQTPVLSFPSPVPVAGISDAGRAGISISGSNGLIVNQAALNSSGRLINDMGPSVFIGAADGSGLMAGNNRSRSLGEIAAMYKSRQTSQNARTITNVDVQKLIGSNRDNANSAPATMAGNMPPTGLPAPEQNSQASQTSNPGPSAQPAAPATSNAASQPAQPGSQSQPATGSEGTSAANSATTPQINQGQSTNASDNENNNRLPATSTLLPLLGLLGIASSGFGLWYRKHRK